MNWYEDIPKHEEEPQLPSPESPTYDSDLQKYSDYHLKNIRIPLSMARFQTGSLLVAAFAGAVLYANMRSLVPNADSLFNIVGVMVSIFPLLLTMKINVDRTKEYKTKYIRENRTYVESINKLAAQINGENFSFIPKKTPISDPPWKNEHLN